MSEVSELAAALCDSAGTPTDVEALLRAIDGATEVAGHRDPQEEFISGEHAAMRIAALFETTRLESIYPESGCGRS